MPERVAASPDNASTLSSGTPSARAIRRADPTSCATPGHAMLATRSTPTISATRDALGMRRMPAATTMLFAALRPLSTRASAATAAPSPARPLARIQPDVSGRRTLTQPASVPTRSTRVPASMRRRTGASMKRALRRSVARATTTCSASTTVAVDAMTTRKAAAMARFMRAPPPRPGSFAPRCGSPARGCHASSRPSAPRRRAT